MPETFSDQPVQSVAPHKVRFPLLFLVLVILATMLLVIALASVFVSFLKSDRFSLFFVPIATVDQIQNNQNVYRTSPLTVPDITADSGNTASQNSVKGDGFRMFDISNGEKKLIGYYGIVEKKTDNVLSIAGTSKGDVAIPQNVGVVLYTYKKGATSEPLPVTLTYEDIKIGDQVNVNLDPEGNVARVVVTRYLD